MFSSTEMSEVLTEVCKMDPNFSLEKFVLWCHYSVIPNILEAIGQGDEEVLKDWCYEAVSTERGIDDKTVLSLNMSHRYCVIICDT